MKSLLLLIFISLFLFSCKKRIIIKYPENGNYGLNVLAKEKIVYPSDSYSFAANLNKKTSVKIRIINNLGGPWFISVGSEENWAVSEYNGTQTFTSVNEGLNCDLNIQFFSGEYVIEYFENKDSSPSFTKMITIN